MKAHFLMREQWRKAELPGDLKLVVEGYSANVFGGPYEATMTVTGNPVSMGVLLHWLRYGVEIYGEMAEPLWWGYVNRVEIEQDGVLSVVDLEEMANEVAVAYTLVDTGGDTVGVRRTTAFSQEAESVQEFGRKQLLESSPYSNIVAANALLTRKLNEGYLPRVFVTPRNGKGEAKATIRCKGWWQSLEWLYCTVPTKMALSFQTIGKASYGGESAKWAQSFTPRSEINLGEIGVYARKIGNPGSLNMAIHADENGKPGVSLASVSIAAVAVGTAFGWVSGMLSSSLALTAGTTYFLVVSGSYLSAGNYFEFLFDAAQGYGDGELSYFYANNWIEDGGDLAFKAYNGAAEVTGCSGGDSLDFRVGLDRADVGQSMIYGAASISGVGIMIRKVGSPTSNVQVRVYRNLGKAGEVQLASGSINAATIDNNWAWKTASWTGVAVNTGEPLDVQVSASSMTETDHYLVAYYPAGGYQGGSMLLHLSNDWHVKALDAPFRLYANAIVETTQQIQNYLTSFGQFLNRVLIDNRSSVSTESYRSGDTTALAEAEAHMDTGTQSGRRLLARVNLDRSVQVWEQEAEPQACDIEIRLDGKLYWRGAGPVPSTFNPVGKWVSVEPVTRSTGYRAGLAGLNAFFVDQCDWDKDGKMRLTPANWRNPAAKGIRNG